jgi:DNA polymerase III subunit epsilon
VTWHRGPIAALDLETTGPDPHEARIVTAALVRLDGPTPTARETWLVDPGIPIPAAATAIHGITTALARAEGIDAASALEKIAEQLVDSLREQRPLVIFNACYDLTVLAGELARHHLPSLAERLGAPIAPVVDPLVLDRHVDRYRKGGRTLSEICRTYRVPLEAPHQADADATAAARLACRIAERHAGIAAMSAMSLHEAQIGWYADWAAGYERWLRRGPARSAVVDRHWPVRPPAASPGGTTS